MHYNLREATEPEEAGFDGQARCHSVAEPVLGKVKSSGVSRSGCAQLKERDTA